MSQASMREGELVGKRLELFMEALPHVRKIAVMRDAYGRFQLEQLEAAARLLGVTLQPIELDASYDFAAAFKDGGVAQAAPSSP